MPDTRPGSIFDKEGVCQACRNYEKRKTINWEERKKQLINLCNKYRRENGYYDCIIPVSGGKDSHFLTYLMKEKMKMNPLLITVADPFTKTEAGKHNLRNLGDTFNCDIIAFNVSVDLFRRATKIGFEKLGEPLKFIEAAIYTMPFKIAMKFNIPLVIYGENPTYEYGTTDKEEYNSGNQYIKKVFEKIDINFWVSRHISLKELNAIIPPTEEELRKFCPDVIFMSYYIPWDGEKNYLVAKRYGFKDLTHEWKREGNIEFYDQLDSVAYIVHLWMKYPKFGFARATDIASRWVRSGKINRKEAKRLIMEYDHKLDQKAMDDFIKFIGYTPRQFWDIVERFWNREIFGKVNGIWRLKNPIYADSEQ